MTSAQQCSAVESAHQGQKDVAGLLHQIAERLTAAGNYLAALRQLLEAAHHKEMLDKALAQLDEADALFQGLQYALQPPSKDHGARRHYRVCFLNHFARGDKTFTVCQRSIVVPDAKSREEAIEAAKKRFARLEGVPDWHLHAATVEAGLIEVNEPAKQAGATSLMSNLDVPPMADRPDRSGRRSK